MRGEDIQQHDLFSYGSLEQRVPADHPLRPIRTMVDEALKSLDGRFEEIYDEDGRKSIPPERLLRALLLQMLYTVRSERMLMEQLEYNLLFRWFVGLSANEPVWHPTVFTKNRDRLLEGAVAEEFFSLLVHQARQKRLLSDDHFTVDGTLIEAWAGQKSFQTKKDAKTLKLPPPQDPGSNPTVNFRKEKPEERNAPIADRSVCAAVQEEQWRRSAALLYGTSGDGEPQWFGSGHTPDSVHRDSGAGCCHGDDEAEARRKATDTGWRPWLRYAGVRRTTARLERHSACGAAHDQPAERD